MRGDGFNSCLLSCMTAIFEPSRQQVVLPQSTLIDTRLRLFLRRRLRDILDHLPNSQDRWLAKRVQNALKKIDTDAYGLCETCGHPIDLGKLLVDPAAEICPCCEFGENCPVDHPLHTN